MNDKITSRYYPHKKGAPELPGNLQGKLAVCFSGGGSRSLSATMGQLRGLNHLGMLHRDKIHCISGVSGGGWAASVYTYRPGEISLSEFLGETVEEPGKLVWESGSAKDRSHSLDYLPEKSMGQIPRGLGFWPFVHWMLKLYTEKGVPPRELWSRAAGKLVLEKYNLFNLDEKGKPTRSMGYTDSWNRENPIGSNPGRWQEQDFQRVPDDPARPFLIVNTALFANKDELLPFEMTPAYAGIAPRYDAGDRIFGGGYLDTYSLGAQRPEKVPTERVALEPQDTPVCLSDALGLTGAFFSVILEQCFHKSEGDPEKLAGEIQKISEEPRQEEQKELLVQNEAMSRSMASFSGVGAQSVKELTPSFFYWPVDELETPPPRVREEKFTDGGALENLGIMPLLSRSCTQIISFINTADPLKKTGGLLQVDSALPPLFGYRPRKGSDPYRKYPAKWPPHGEIILDPTEGYFRDNQVFESSGFDELLDGLASASKGGWFRTGLGNEPAVFLQHLTTVENKKFGVPGGLKVKVLWVYNTPARSWEKKLSCSVRLRMLLDKIKFGDFPNYSTVSKFHLETRQVNLLAHFSSWVVLQKKELFLEMLDSPS